MAEVTFSATLNKLHLNTHHTHSAAVRNLLHPRAPSSARHPQADGLGAGGVAPAPAALLLRCNARKCLYRSRHARSR